MYQHLLSLFRERQKQTEIHLLIRSSDAHHSWGWSHEPGTQARSPTWEAGTLSLGPHRVYISKKLESGGERGTTARRRKVGHRHPNREAQHPLLCQPCTDARPQRWGTHICGCVSLNARKRTFPATVLLLVSTRNHRKG